MSWSCSGHVVVMELHGGLGDELRNEYKRGFARTITFRVECKLMFP